MSTPTNNADSFFRFVTAWPKTIVLLSMLAIAGLAVFVPQIHKDTSSDAFIAKDDPVVVYREQVREIFGLEDPIVIAVINDGSDGIFNATRCRLLCRAIDCNSPWARSNSRLASRKSCASSAASTAVVRRLCKSSRIAFKRPSIKFSFIVRPWRKPTIVSWISLGQNLHRSPLPHHLLAPIDHAVLHERGEHIRFDAVRPPQFPQTIRSGIRTENLCQKCIVFQFQQHADLDFPLD